MKNSLTKREGEHSPTVPKITYLLIFPVSTNKIIEIVCHVFFFKFHVE